MALVWHQIQNIVFCHCHGVTNVQKLFSHGPCFWLGYQKHVYLFFFEHGRNLHYTLTDAKSMGTGPCMQLRILSLTGA
jgi:hypothetical protein